MSNWLSSLASGVTSLLPSYNLISTNSELIGAVRDSTGRVVKAVAEEGLLESYTNATNGTAGDNGAYEGFVLGLASITIAAGFGLTLTAYMGYKAYGYCKSKIEQYQAGHSRMLTNVEHGGTLDEADVIDEREVDLTFPVYVDDAAVNKFRSEREPLSKVKGKGYGEEVVDLK